MSNLIVFFVAVLAPIALIAVGLQLIADHGWVGFYWWVLIASAYLLLARIDLKLSEGTK